MMKFLWFTAEDGSTIIIRASSIDLMRDEGGRAVVLLRSGLDFKLPVTLSELVSRINGAE